VYRGVDPDIGRDVAIKVPRPEVLMSLEKIQRFSQEARAVSQLEHPNILPVYESQITEVVRYIAMPYIAGGSLGCWLATRREITPRQAAEITRQLAEGIAHSHERGILHRDVKPANVLLGPPDPASCMEPLSFVPKLTDFGLAKCEDAVPYDTTTGTVMGTTCYMAPEQARGSAREITARTDIYGVGAVLYELLTGVPPFQGENNFQTIQLILQKDPVSIQQIRRDIPNDLALICQTCLEKLQSARYATARALADDLARFLRGEPIAAHPATWRRNVAKWSRRHPAYVGTLITGLWGLLLMLGISLWYNSRLTDQLQIAEASRQSADRERELAQNNELTVRRRAYVSDMRNAKLNWDRGDVRHMLRLLDRYRPRNGQSDIRDFAWWYLWRECHESSRILGQHEKSATAVAITRSGDIAASGGADSVIRLWTLPAGRLIAELQGHESGAITSVSFSPTGERLASAGEDGTVRIWEVANGKELFVLRDHRSLVGCVAYSPHRDLIASGGTDGNVRLWNSETGTPEGVLAGHSEKVGCLAFHPSDPILISGSLDGTIRSWNLNDDRTGAHLQAQAVFDLNTHRESIHSSESYPRAIAIESNGNSLIIATTLREVVQIGLRNHIFGDVIRRNTEVNQPRALIWPREDGWLVGLANSQIRMANQQMPEQTLIALNGHFDAVLSIAASEDAKCLVSASRDGSVRYWPDFRGRTRIRATPAEIDSVTESPGCQSVQWCDEYLAADFQQQVSLFRMPERKLERTIPKGIRDHSLLSPSGKYLLIIKPDGFASCTCVEDGNVLWPSRILAEPQGLNVAIDKSDQWMAVTCGNDVLTVQSVPNGEVVQRLKHPTVVGQHLFLESEDASPRLMTMCIRGVLRFWDVPSGRLLQEHPLISVTPHGMGISKDRQFLAIESNDHKIRVWQLENMTEVASIPTDPKMAQVNNNHVHFLASETLAYYSGGISLWNIREDAELLAFPELSSNKGFAISPDGNQLATCINGAIYFIDGRPLVESEKQDRDVVDPTAPTWP